MFEREYSSKTRKDFLPLRA